MKKTLYTKPLSACIIDTIEDFLDRKGVDIPNADKVGDETEAHIYGEDFDALMERFNSLLEEVGESLGVEVNTEDWHDSIFVSGT